MDVTAAPGRRDRKKTATREALRRAALRLALEQGYETLTVEAITEEADVSLRTFFNYFASKEEALLGPDPDRGAALAEALLARPADEEPVAALRAVFEQLAHSFAERQPLWQARMQLVRANPQLWPRLHASFTEFERAVAHAVAARTGRDPEEDLFPGVAAAAAVGAMRAAVAQWRAGGESASLPDLVMRAFDVLAAGLDASASDRPGGSS
jgi:AcrR family transcriptional regulator